MQASIHRWPILCSHFDNAHHGFSPHREGEARKSFRIAASPLFHLTLRRFTPQAFDRARQSDIAPQDLSSAGKIMVCFGRRHRRRKVATGREYRVFGILRWRRSRQPALIARKQLYLLPRFAPTTWSSVAPQTGSQMHLFKQPGHGHVNFEICCKNATNPQLASGDILQGKNILVIASTIDFLPNFAGVHFALQ